MPKLIDRIARLESKTKAQGGQEVALVRFVKPGALNAGFIRIKNDAGETVERLSDESEDAFIERAKEALTEKKDNSISVLMMYSD